MSELLTFFHFQIINISRKKNEKNKAPQVEIDGQFIFNSIIYEIFILLGYVGQP